MQAFRSHHQHFGDELIKAVIDQHVGDFITNFGDGLIPCRQNCINAIGNKLVNQSSENFYLKHRVILMLCC